MPKRIFNCKPGQLHALALSAWWLGNLLTVISPAFAAPPSTAIVTVSQTGDPCLHILGTHAEVGPTSVTVSGRVSRSRMSTVLSQHELEIGIYGASGGALMTKRLPVGPAQLPRRNSQLLAFSVTLPHVPQAEEKIFVKLERVKKS